MAYRIGATPNALTGASVVLSLLGLLTVVLAGSAFPGAVGAVLLLLAGYALDSADGQLARLTGTGSKAGEWLDHVVDAARLPLTHLAITVFLFIQDAPLGFVVASILFQVLASVWFFGQILAEKLGASSRSASTAPAWVSFAKLPYDTAAIYFVLLLLPWPPQFYFVYVALLVFTLVVASVSLWRKYRSLRLQP